MSDPAIHTLQRVWGFESFQGQQERAVRAALEGRDTLVVFPTGAGKSITYQLPALLLEGTAVVVSPLIALMKDQVDGLRANGVAAAALNSTLSPAERAQVVTDLRNGSLKLLYMSPEGLLTDSGLSLLREARISFFAIDEAHCISHWGHDFRQEYRALGRLRELFPEVPIHACTATATPQVRDDILRSLQLCDPDVLVSPFDRPNLTYRFVPRANAQRQLEDVLDRHRGHAGIVYCLSRKEVESTAEHLVKRGWNARPYHAGLDTETRRRNQEAFSTEQVDVIVATVAFGMGIDRSDVRFVMHMGMPKSVEHYQQEAGRAGRDGLDAECVLLHSGQDVIQWKGLLARRDNAPVDPEADRVALGKLNDMYALCRALTCRHRALVRYFGQDMPDGACGACDFCLGEYEMVADSVTIARKILSGVARVRERFGTRHVADVLKGSRSERIVNLGHDQLSTHGILADFPSDTISDWIDQLVASDHLARGDGEYPTLRLTDVGRALMARGEGAVALSMPRHKKKGKREDRGVTPVGPGHPDLFERLRVLRRRLAQARGVPPFVIFSDATLTEMTARIPTTEAAFRRVKGVGDAKASTLAEPFLTEIRAWCEEHPDLAPQVSLPAPSSDAAPALAVTGDEEAAPSPRPSRSAAEAARALFAEGRSVEDVARELDRAHSTVEQYLFGWLRDNPGADLRPWLDEATHARIKPLLMASENGMLKPIYEGLNEEVPYLQIRLAKFALTGSVI